MDAKALANMLIDGQIYEIKTYRGRVSGPWRQEPLFVQ